MDFNDIPGNDPEMLARWAAQDQIRADKLAPVAAYLRPRLQGVDIRVGLDSLYCHYANDLLARQEAGGIAQALVEIRAVQKASEDLHEALGKLGEGALGFLERPAIPAIQDLMHKVGNLDPPSWWKDNPEEREPTMPERLEALAYLARNAAKAVEEVGGCGGRRNMWDLAHGTPLLSLMGEIALFLERKQALILPVARRIHEAVSGEPPPPGEWGKDEAARARAWLKAFGEWWECPPDSWPPEIEDLREKGPAAIPSPKQARNRKRRTTTCG